MHIQSFVPVTLAALLVAAPVAAQTTGAAGAGAQAQTGTPAGAGAGATGSGAATTPAPGSTTGSTPVPGGAGASAGVTAGASVYDPQGGLVGTIEAVEAGQAVLSTGSVKVRVPVTSFGSGSSGLLIGMTKQELEAAAGKAK